MIWIIGFWHVFDYIEYNAEAKEVMRHITISVLACFTFISGFFLGKKQISVREFYLNRFKRFYLLFFVASTLLLLSGWYRSFSQYFFSLTGLSNFILPQPGTLWYISMLLLLYLVTPLLAYSSKSFLKNPPLVLAARCLLLIAILYICQYFSCIDYRTPFYSFFYIAGLLTPYSLYEELMEKRAIVLLFGGAYFVGYLITGGGTLNLFHAAIGALLIIVISSFVRSVSGNHLGRMWSALAYSSLCAYLFHRLIYMFFTHIAATQSGQIPLFWIPVIVAVILLASYSIQWLYDNRVISIINKVLK